MVENRGNRGDIVAGDGELEALRYPVGRYERVERPGAADRAGWVEDLAALPGRLRAAVSGLNEEQLDTPYREGGWTIRQVVHHVPDSHMNGYIRMTLALAEEGRSAAPYDEARWAEQGYARTGAIESSLTLLEGLHARWVATARGLGEEDLRRTIEWGDRGAFSVADMLGLYAWHSRHHTAHVVRLRERRGW